MKRENFKKAGKLVELLEKLELAKHSIVSSAADGGFYNGLRVCEHAFKFTVVSDFAYVRDILLKQLNNDIAAATVELESL